MFHYLELRIFLTIIIYFTFNYLMSGYFDDTFSEYYFQCSILVLT